MPRIDDLNFNNGSFIPTYAGIPLKEITDTADVLSQRHYSNIAEASKLEILANQMKSKLLPGAREYVDGTIKSITDSISQMATNGGENSTARVGALSRTLLGDQHLLRGLDQAKAYEEFKKTRDSLTSQGLDPVWNQGLEQQYLDAGITDSLYNSPFNLVAQKRLNYMEQQDKVLEPLKPDAWESSLKEEAQRAGMELPLYLKSTKFQELTSKKVQEYLFADSKGPDGKIIKGKGWTSYKDSPEYRQQKMSGMNDEQIKAELFSRGEAKVFRQYDNSYMSIPRDVRHSGGDDNDPANNRMATYAPGQALQTLFNYDSDGKTWAPSFSTGSGNAYDGYDAGNPISKLVMGAGNLISNMLHTDIDPQFVKDYKTMREITGEDPNVAPDSKEARQSAAQYKQLVQMRVSNPAVLPFTANKAREKSAELQNQFSLYTYMDQATGETVTPFDKEGKLDAKFKKLTGGDVSKFEVESIYGPKNHYTLGNTASEKFVTPMAVVSEDSDGNPVRFLVSSLPAQTSPVDINTNAIYTKINLRPGQEVELSPRVKAREAHGAQLNQYIQTKENPGGIATPEEMANADMPIIATVDGQQIFASSADELSRYLLTLSNPIVLPIK